MALTFWLSIAFIVMIVLKAAFKKRENGKRSLMVVLGSGGHTSEMLMMLNKAQFNNYSSVFFVIGKSDRKSKEVLDMFLQQRDSLINDFITITLPRPNEVGDGKLLASIKTIYSTLYCLVKLLQLNFVNVLICNGPGICVPIIISTRLLNVF